LKVWGYHVLRDGWGQLIGGSVTAAVFAELAGYRMWALAVLILPAVTAVWAVTGSSRRHERKPGPHQPIRSFDDGMTVLDREGRVTGWDHGLERVLGSSREDVLGRGLLDAVPMLAETMVPQMISTVLASGEPP
jgi:PAS domain-containing protein